MNNAATLLHMSGGLFNVPIVIRMATGGGKQLAAQHSHSLEGWYAHIPGLKVLTPATVEDAHGMLLAALEDKDPVLIFENSTLYNKTGMLPANPKKVNIEKAKVIKSGTDISLITYGIGVDKALEAAEQLNKYDIDVEVVDLRVLRPLDTATIIQSVRKTHRALIIDEGWRSGGISAEISARITEHAFYDLDQPVSRICGAEVPMPYAKHSESAAVPQVNTIIGRCQKLLQHERV